MSDNEMKEKEVDELGGSGDYPSYWMDVNYCYDSCDSFYEEDYLDFDYDF